MKRTMLLFLGLAFFVGACSAASDEESESVSAPSIVERMGMGRQNGMMARHRAVIPEEYAGLTNPVPADEESLARGAESFTTLCATCHGDGGMGDGPAGTSLDPAPAAIAHTSQMLGDDYLFWRISEGGAMDPFNSAMPVWSGTLDETARWDVINYIQALGSGAIKPREVMGGAAFIAVVESAQRGVLFATAVDPNVITQK